MHIYYYCFEKISPRSSANTHVIEVVKNLVHLGNSIELFLPRLQFDFHDSHEQNLNYIYIPFFKIGAIKWLIYDLFSFWYLIVRAILRRPDLIYFRETQSLVPLLVSKLIRRKLIIEVNGWVIDELRMVGYPNYKLKLLQFFQRINFRQADGIIAVSPGIMAKIRETYRLSPVKLCTIGNGTNPTHFRPMDMRICKTKLQLEPKRDYIGFLGSCYPYHGLENLITAAPLILNELPEARFIIAGEGISRAQWQRQVDQLGLSDKFIFPGMIPTAIAPVWINAFTICVAPWQKKYMNDIGVSPLKLFDYMACAKPIVASRIRGVTEIIEKYRCGFAIEVENPVIFAEHLKLLLRNDQLRAEMGDRGRAAVLKHHTWEHTTKATLNFIQHIQSR